ncbi:MAG: T9SS type A sorting domain-containing protein [Bacteroidota bacterium]
MKKLYIFFSFLFIINPTLFAQKAAPVALKDTIDLVAGQTLNLMVLANDYDPDGDSIFITLKTNPHYGILNNMGTHLDYESVDYFNGLDSLLYKISDGTLSSPWTKVYLRIADCHCFDSVNMNNVNAAIHSDGAFFWDKASTAYFKVPSNGNISSIFTFGLAMVAFDSAGNMHAAAERYEYPGPDYQAGPVSNSYDSLHNINWHRLWKVTRQQVNDHIANWYSPGYIIPDVFLQWPAHGDTTQGEAFYLAPFFDYNGNGIYDPLQGDYPLIRGDMSIFFLFNDDTPVHLEAAGGLPLKAEVQGLLYAFDCDADSALWNTMFMHLRIANRSHNVYDSTRFGFLTDFDIGYSSDDLIGTDVQRNSIFGYNGDSVDYSPAYAEGYGPFPPSQSTTILKGPLMDSDGTDNPDGIDYGINGYGFGDGIDDNECFGMTGMMPVTRDFIQYPMTSDPNTAFQYYLFLNNYWKDTTRLNYGGMGHVSDPASCGPATNFAYPGDTDPLHWGTNYSMPACHANDWTEYTNANQPSERSSIVSMGSFTFYPGDMQEMDFAFVFGRDYVNPSNLAAIPVMQQRIDSVRKYFLADATPCGLGFSNVPVIAEKPSMRVFPNPVSNILNIEIPAANSNANYIIFNLQGSIVLSNKNVNARSMSISTQSLMPGMYFIRVESGASVYSAKFVKH